MYDQDLKLYDYIHQHKPSFHVQWALEANGNPKDLWLNEIDYIVFNPCFDAKVAYTLGQVKSAEE